MLKKRYILLLLTTVILFTIYNGCSERETVEPVVPSDSEVDLANEENKVFGEVSDTSAGLPGEVFIEGLGAFPFDPNEIKTIREDIFM